MGKRTVSVSFQQPPTIGINKYHMYTIKVDGQSMVTLFGGMAAIAAEVVARYLESGAENISARDIFQRCDDGNER